MDNNQERHQQFNQNIITEMWNIDNYIQDSLGNKRNTPSLKERTEWAELKKKEHDKLTNKQKLEDNPAQG